MSDPGAFFDLLRQSFENGSFLKLTLSRPEKEAPPGLRNLFLRPVEIRGTAMVSWTFRYERRDEVKNLAPAETLTRLRGLCGPQFRNAALFTTGHEATLTHNRRGEPGVTIRRAAGSAPVTDTAHDRDKPRLIDPAAPWLRDLGITGPHGAVLPSSQAKWRQINKFIEIAAGLVRSAGLSSGARIADMGCGKGYLTFALYDYLTTQLQHRPSVTGVEMRPELVTLCNEAARRAAFDGLHFEAGAIHGWQPGPLDMLIALHACDTATDEALAAGIRAEAAVIVVAPCCHRQIRRSMAAHNELTPLLQHGILAERQAEIITDGLRALVLESRGYRTRVFEFISTEHTAKNLMITAVRQGVAAPRALEQAEAVKASFGIREFALESLLDSAGS